MEYDTEVGNTTSSAAEVNTDGAGEWTNGSQPRRARKARDPNKLHLKRQEFTQVSPKGVPEEPGYLVKGYGLQIGCIVRETLPITTGDLTHRDRGHLREALFTKLHARYKFPKLSDDLDYNTNEYPGNPVNKAALTTMSTALASWRNRVKKMIDKGISFEEIHKKNPTLTEDSYLEFKAWCESDAGRP